MARKTKERNTDPNLLGLYAVSRDVALTSGGKPRAGVYGMVTRDTPFITRPKAKSGSKLQFMRDMTDIRVPTVLKNRILAFWDDPNNGRKEHCYLVEKPLYEEMMEAHKIASPRSSSKKPTAKKSTKKGGRK